jgi:hypothetical protein
MPPNYQPPPYQRPPYQQPPYQPPPYQQPPYQQPPYQRGQQAPQQDVWKSELNPEDRMMLLMPKTVVSIAIWILMFGLGAGVSGLVWFIIYQQQLNGVEDRLIKSQEQLSKRFDEKLKELQSSGTTKSPNLNSSSLPGATEVSPSDDPNSPASQLQSLLSSVGPAIAAVEGQDAKGGATSGSGFVVNVNSGEAWVVTSYHLVAGAVGKGQVVRVRLGGFELLSEVYASDPARDLALVIFQATGQKALRLSRDPLEAGTEVWAISSRSRGINQADGSPAHIADVSPAFLVLDVDVPSTADGGPLVDKDGNVVGVVTGSSKAADASGGASHRSAVPIETICSQVVKCPNLTKASPSPSATPAPTSSPG